MRSFEPLYAYGVDEKALGEGIHYYGGREDIGNGEFGHIKS
jgi:hypothetical protein